MMCTPVFRTTSRLLPAALVVALWSLAILITQCEALAVRNPASLVINSKGIRDHPKVPHSTFPAPVPAASVGSGGSSSRTAVATARGVQEWRTLAASLVLASSFAFPARALDSSSIITSTNSDLPPIHQMDIRKAPAFPYDNRAAVEEPLLQLGDFSPIHQLVRQGMLLADSTISEGAEPERSLATQAGLAFFLTYVGVSMLAGFKELFTRIQKYSRGDK